MKYTHNGLKIGSTTGTNDIRQIIEQRKKFRKKNKYMDEQISDPDRIKNCVSKIHDLLMQENVSIAESSKIIELVQEDIENAKKLILREPLDSAFKYKED